MYIGYMSSSSQNTVDCIMMNYTMHVLELCCSPNLAYFPHQLKLNAPVSKYQVLER